MSEPASDLTGAWEGLYSYPNGGSTPFSAELVEADGWLTGNTGEKATEGAFVGQTITAMLMGRRSGDEVTFLKTYDGELDLYDDVQYAGRVNADASEIEGRWSVAGVWSGPFLMVRRNRSVEAAVRRVAERAR